MIESFDMYMLIVVALVAVVAIAIMIRRVTPYFRFAYPNAKVQAIGNPFVRERELSQLIESKTFGSFKNSLNTSRDYDVKGENAEEIQRSLDKHLINIVEMIKKDSPKNLNELFDTYLSYLDGNSLKTAIKQKLLDMKVDVNPLTKGNQQIVDIISSSPIDNLAEILQTRGFNKEVTNLIKSEKTDLLALDVAIDKYLLSCIKRVKVPREIKETRDEFVSRLIDIINIRNILRAKDRGYDNEYCKKLFVGDGREIARWKFNEMSERKSIDDVASTLGGTYYFSAIKKEIDITKREKTLQPLEIALDKLILDISSSLSVKNYSFIGPIIRFITARRYEIQNLKVIVKGIEEKINPSKIRSLLVIEGG